MKFQVGDVVRLVKRPSHAVSALPIGNRAVVVGVDNHDEALPYDLRIEGLDFNHWAAETDIEPWIDCTDGERDRLNAEADCYRKEAQEARTLQRKFYDEVQELRRLLAQVTAERDAANQQCACAVQKLDDLRACLKALAR